MGFHLAQMALDLGAERRHIVVSHEGGHLFQALAVVGKRMGLLVVDHLQAVFGAPEEGIGVREVAPRRLGDMAQRGQRLKGLKRAAAAQFGLPAAPDQLLGLGEEFDLADAAPAQLDVVASHRDLAAAAMGVDLALDRMNVLDGGEIQRLAPDIGLQAGQELAAGRDVAGHRPGLDHRRPLPVLAEAFVIDLGRQHRERHRRRARIGTQPQVDAEHVALGGPFLQQLHQVAGQADDVVEQPVGLAGAHLLGIEQDNEVDVAGIVELARPQLAHAEDDQAGVPLGVVGVDEFDVPGRGGAPEHAGGRNPDGGVGEGRKRPGDPLERPIARDVGHRHGQGHAPLGDAKRAADVHPLGGRGAKGGERGHDVGRNRVGPPRHQVQREAGIAGHGERQVGAVAEDGLEQPAAIGARHQFARKGLQCGVVLLADGIGPLLHAQAHAIRTGAAR